MPTKRKNALGKGMDTLIPAKIDSKSSEHVESTKVKEVVKEIIKEVVKETEEVDINKIEPNTDQPRKVFDEDAIHELAESIKKHGIIQPLVVQKGKKGFYTIIAGERRWRAARAVGLKKLPVVIKEYSDQEVMEIALIENIQREDLNAVEEAEAYERLIAEYNLKQDEVAERVSKSRVAITNSLRLLKLDKRVREMIIEDKIKSGHARALLAITDGEQQYKMALLVFDGKLSVRETEKMVRKAIKDAENQNSKEKNVDKNSQDVIIYKNFEEQLKSVMGTKVNINHKAKGKGKIEIEYYSPDEFDRIVEMIMQMKNK